MSEYRAELVQVAAVAVAMIECYDDRAAGSDGSRTNAVLAEVAGERVRQNDRWGSQSHGPFVWLAVLTEEVGEVAQAALERGLR